MEMDNYTFTVPGPKHKHQCPACGCIWEHGDDCVDSESAHTCPRCGERQWFKYNGPEGVTKVVKDKYTFHL